MKRWLNITAQVLGILGQMLVPSLPLTPDQQKAIHGLLGAAQAIIAVIAHQYNTDGTPQSEAKS